jgi:catechol 2,3-dioxygenase-like lactoylglutathione lyase family enzyme
MWINYFGIRVTDLGRSIDFYTRVFNLVEIARGGNDIQKYVLFKDRMSGQRIELNWYGRESKFATPYVAGEGLDHIGVRVRTSTTRCNGSKAWGSFRRPKSSEPSTIKDDQRTTTSG